MQQEQIWQHAQYCVNALREMIKKGDSAAIRQLIAQENAASKQVKLKKISTHMVVTHVKCSKCKSGWIAVTMMEKQGNKTTKSEVLNQEVTAELARAIAV